MPVRPDRPSGQQEQQGRTGPARIPSRYVGCRDRPYWARCKGRGSLRAERRPVARSRVPGDIVSSGLGQEARAIGLGSLLVGALLAAPVAPRQVAVLVSGRRLLPPLPRTAGQ